VSISGRLHLMPHLALNGLNYCLPVSLACNLWRAAYHNFIIIIITIALAIAMDICHRIVSIRGSPLIGHFSVCAFICNWNCVTLFFDFAIGHCHCHGHFAIAIAIAILVMCFLRTSGESTCKLAHFAPSSVIYASNGAQ